MTPQEFENAVRELRQRQRRFFRCRKDDPDREMALGLMRETEKTVRQVLDANRRYCHPGNPKSKREEFFMVVDDMVQKQTAWMRQGGGSGFMYAAHEAEKMVDKWLKGYDDEHREEERRRQKAIEEMQPKLF